MLYLRTKRYTTSNKNRGKLTADWCNKTKKTLAKQKRITNFTVDYNLKIQRKLTRSHFELCWYRRKNIMRTAFGKFWKKRMYRQDHEKLMIITKNENMKLVLHYVQYKSHDVPRIINDTNEDSYFHIRWPFIRTGHSRDWYCCLLSNRGNS